MSNNKRDKRALIILGVFLIIFIPVCIAVNNGGGSSSSNNEENYEDINEEEEDLSEEGENE